jgi:hypothetical protein
VLTAGLADRCAQRLQGLADLLSAAFQPEGAHRDGVAVAVHLGVLKEPDHVLLVVGDAPADGDLAHPRQLARGDLLVRQPRAVVAYVGRERFVFEGPGTATHLLLQSAQ